MLINAVSAKDTPFGRSPSREDFEQFAAIDDRQLRQLAGRAASVQVNDKKHKVMNNMLWYSLPVASGVAAVVQNPSVVGRIPKLKLFTKQTAIIAGMLAVIDATFAAARGINKHSETLGNFNKEHPVMSTLLTIGASVGALLLAGKGAGKLYEKYGDKAIKFLKDKKVDKYIKDNKLITKATEALKKAPSALKEFGKTVLSWGPWIVLGTTIAHSFGHEKARAVAEVRNYDYLKANQEKVREALDAVEE